ncbi:rRNA maturation factor [Thermosipho affectus]|uniref:Endoribonuclease YbeY n=1 Tax=Thermosipho affectus TaxID=660294 RepID=A0ABX3IHV0_9BACT|nr:MULTISPECIES: rRNA maturation RNase YbeY [Thermosipho]ANQ54036.1 rRNA maturation factor [Thermosipho sp. 1070]ONN26903.1 rRNA maturation factor [Thermosipho affectus]OOC42660.1 rRNA maturation factor [Thermosipho sp. 1074]
MITTNKEIDKKYTKIVKEITKNELGKEVNINIIFVSKEEIKKLNNTFRKKDTETDVLTFVYGDDDLFAEIYICEDVIKRNAETFSNSFEKELLMVLIHASLHCCGYDHEYDTTNAELMFKIQNKYYEKYLKKFNL